MESELEIFKHRCAELESRLSQAKAEIERLRLQTPAQKAQKMEPMKSIGPTNYKFFGLQCAEEDFDDFGHLV